MSSAGVALLVALLLGMAVAPVSAAPSVSAPSLPALPVAPGPGSPVEDFTSCLNSTRTGDVLLLIDESSSLRTSDPGAARVTAARYLLSRLAGVADTTGFRLSASVAGFSDRYAPAVGWTPLDGGSLPALTGAVDGFAGRTDGFETDYWGALEGARRSLADQTVAAAGQRRCQAVAWFSDGRLDLTPRVSADERADHDESKPYAEAPLADEPAAERAEAAAREALCRPRAGLADQLRAAGVVLFGIGLDARSRPGDFDLMAAVSTGRAAEAGGAPGAGCGQPTERPRGEFRLASDLDDLLFAFDALVPPGPPLPQTRPVCARTVCPEGRHAFVVDGSVRRVEILGTVDRPGVTALLVPPVGEPIPVATGRGPRTETRGRATVTSERPADRTVSVSLTSPDRGPGWSGEWALVFVDPVAAAPGGTSRTQIRITGDLLPAWADTPAVLHSGDRVPGRFVLVDGAGREVPAAGLPGEATLSTTLLAPGRPPAPVSTADKTNIGRPATLDLAGVPPGPATLRLSLDQRTAAAVRADGTPVTGTALVPQSVEVALSVTPPAGYPRLAPSVSFGTGDGDTELTTTLGATGPGCVWVPPQTAPPLDAAPADAGRITVGGVEARSPQTCRVLGPDQDGEVEVGLSTEQVGNGTVSGTFVAMVAPPGVGGVTGTAAAQPVTVGLDADLRRPLDPVDFVAALVAATVLGLLVPLALLYLAKYVTARIPGRPLAAARVPITVGGVGPDGAAREVLRDGRPLDVADRELVDLVRLPARGARSLTVHGVTLRVRWATLLRAPRVLAGVDEAGRGAQRGRTIEPGRIRAASGHRPAREGDAAVLPLAVHNNWVVLHDRAGPPDRADLLLMISAGADTPPTLRRSLLDDAARRVPDVLEGLRDPGAGPHGPGPQGPRPHGPGPQGPRPHGPGPQGPPGGPREPGPFDLGPSGPRPAPTPTPTPGGPW